MLSKTADSDSIATGSIVQSVPPLGDLDLIVHESRPPEALRQVANVLERFRSYVPASRFIHFDVFFQHLPVRGDSPLGNVIVSGLPEVAIRTDNERSDAWTALVSSRDQQVKVDFELRAQEVLFRDFLFLLRLSQRYPEINGATSEVAKLLTAEEPRSIGLATRYVGGARELARIDKALVKHVLFREIGPEPTPITDYLPRPWLGRFSTHLNGLSRNIIRSEASWRQTPAIAYTVNGTVKALTAVTDLDVEEHKVLSEKLALESSFLGQRLTPSLPVMLPDPDDPECRNYGDFSKGVSELVFGNLNIGPLQNVMLMEGREKYYAVHAQASEGFGVNSLRTDPGFMSMLNHRTLRIVRLMGVKDQ